MSRKHKELYEFSRYSLDVSERILRREDERVPLTDKAFDTLCVLVRRGGELVGKDQLMAEVWPETIVEENNLDQKISVLRQALRKRGKRDEKFIETVRGHGYRFVADVRRIEEEANGKREEATAGLQVTTGEANNRTNEKIDNFTGQIKQRKWLAVLALAAFFVAASGLGYYFWPEDKPAMSAGGKRSLAVLPFVNTDRASNAEIPVGRNYRKHN